MRELSDELVQLCGRVVHTTKSVAQPAGGEMRSSITRHSIAVFVGAGQRRGGATVRPLGAMVRSVSADPRIRGAGSGSRGATQRRVGAGERRAGDIYDVAVVPLPGASAQRVGRVVALAGSVVRVCGRSVLVRGKAERHHIRVMQLNGALVKASGQRVQARGRRMGDWTCRSTVDISSPCLANRQMGRRPCYPNPLFVENVKRATFSGRHYHDACIHAPLS